LIFFGLGEILKQVKEFIFEIISFTDNRKIKKIEIKEEKLIELKLKNIDYALEILAKHNVNDDAKKNLIEELNIDIEGAKDLVSQGKIKELKSG